MASTLGIDPRVKVKRTSRNFFAVDVEIRRAASTSWLSGAAGHHDDRSTEVSDVNLAAVLVAPVLAFVVSTSWYLLFGKRLADLLGRDPAAAAERPPVWMILVELVRSLVVAAVFAGLVAGLDLAGWADGATLALTVWVGFPAVLLSGSVLWDKVPWRVAAIHGGDWLVKLLLFGVLLGAWQ
jgi:hypothetical protein